MALVSIFLPAPLIFLFQNCGPVQFSKDTTYSHYGNKCTETLIKTQKNLRIIFMVDNSDSTWDTDPNKTLRIDTISDFIQKYQAKQNFSYAYGIFSGTKAYVYDSVAQDFVLTPTAPFGNVDFLADALDSYKFKMPQGSTPYSAAFSAITNLVTTSLGVPTNPKDFVVVFMSDGMPTDLSSPQLPKVANLVNNLKSSAQALGGAVNVSSVYFGSANSYNESIVRTIAEQGSGQYLDTNQTNGNLLIDDLIIIPGESCN